MIRNFKKGERLEVFERFIIHPLHLIKEQVQRNVKGLMKIESINHEYVDNEIHITIKGIKL